MRVSNINIAPYLGRSIIQPGWEGERNYGARKEKRDEVYLRGKTGEEKKGRHIYKKEKIKVDTTIDNIDTLRVYNIIYDTTHHHNKQTHNVIISQG